MTPTRPLSGRSEQHAEGFLDAASLVVKPKHLHKAGRFSEAGRARQHDAGRSARRDEECTSWTLAYVSVSRGSRAALTAGSKGKPA